MEITQVLSHQQAGYAAIIFAGACISMFVFVSRIAFAFAIRLYARLRRLENYAARKCKYDPED